MVPQPNPRPPSTSVLTVEGGGVPLTEAAIKPGRFRSEERALDITPLPPADDAATVESRHEANRASWNEAAAHYTALVDETIAFIRAGRSNLHPIERRNLGPLAPWCETAI